MTFPLTEKYDALKFVMAENLPQDLWNSSPKKSGLVIVATKVDSIPRDTVIPINTTPSQFIKELSKDEGITAEKMDELIKTLRGVESEDSQVQEKKEENKEEVLK